MVLSVNSEIGALRRVLIHRPGLEIDWMVPSMIADLLFDDILFGEEAREEHARFCRILEAAGAEVLDVQDLLAEALVHEEARLGLLTALERDYGAEREAVDRLASLPPDDLAAALVTGVRRGEEVVAGRRRSLFDLAPIPNYFFQRDPQLVVGDRVIISSMATDAREREPLLARTAFERHPLLAGHAALFEIDRPPSGAPEHSPEFAYPTLEGGDVLVVSSETLVVGISERTNRPGVEILAEYLRREATPFRNLILVELPRRRSYMHLDTVFTVIDHGICLAYLPVIRPGGPEAARVYTVDLDGPELAFTVAPSLLEALAGVGIELDPVPCGGERDVIEQQREQWTDGANAFAIAPGVILLYRRNRRTIEELERRGWRVLPEEAVLDGGEPVLGRGRTVITILGNELSRARGGPRCMTMPLEREG